MSKEHFANDGHARMDAGVGVPDGAAGRASRHFGPAWSKREGEYGADRYQEEPDRPDLDRGVRSNTGPSGALLPLRPTRIWIVLALVGLIAAGAAIGSSALRSRAKSLFHLRHDLEAVESEAYRLSSLEWRAIAAGHADRQIRNEIDDANGRIGTLLDQMKSATDDPAFDRVVAEVDAYALSIERRVKAYEGVRMAGLALTVSDTNKAFRDLSTQLDALGQVYWLDASRSERLATAGSVAAILLAALLVAGAIRRAERARVREAELRTIESLEEQLRHHAYHDQLTGLPNRALFSEHVESSLERIRRGAAPLAVLFLDLDDFKAVNDTLGHLVGDQLLAQTALRLQSSLRESDSAARLGGDEFAVLIENIESTQTLDRVVRRLIAEVSKPFDLSPYDPRVTVSIGTVTSEYGHETADELLRNADYAMYAAKRRGKARYERFEQHRRMFASDARQELDTDLILSIERDELLLNYQPIADLRSGRMVGVEALVRWRRPTRGLMMPDEFVPLAEQIGFIDDLNRWVLSTASRQLQAWRSSHPDADPFFVAVNLSPQVLLVDDLAKTIARCIEESGIEPDGLMLELGERALLENGELTSVRMRELRELGVRLSIDGFGTGYSSGHFLDRLSIDAIKIDRSFVLAIQTGPEVATLVRAVVKLCKSMGVKVIAGGLETAMLLERLKEWGCDYGQGSLLATPVPPNEIDALLTGFPPWGLGLHHLQPGRTDVDGAAGWFPSTA